MISPENWSVGGGAPMETKRGWSKIIDAVCNGNTLPSYTGTDYFISLEIKIPMNQSGFHGMSIQGFWAFYFHT